MKRRCRMDIYAEILKQALEGANKTRIMYRANLSFYQLKQSLKELLSLRLIELQSLSYKTTGRGLLFLELYDQIESLVGYDKQQYLVH